MSICKCALAHFTTVIRQRSITEKCNLKMLFYVIVCYGLWTNCANTFEVEVYRHCAHPQGEKVCASDAERLLIASAIQLLR